MVSNPFRQIARSSDLMLREQFANLRTQIPLMYALMFINATCLGVATYGDVRAAYSLGFPALLLGGITVRAGIWITRSFKDPEPTVIRRYLYGTIWAAVVLSIAFGGWGLLLLQEAGPARVTAIALYVFVGSISCCYCLQAIPIAGRCVLLFGALPVTLQLLASSDQYLAGIGFTFILVSVVILYTLATSHAAFENAVKTQSEMATLITALRQSEEHYQYSVDLNPQIPWISDPRGLLIELSPRWTVLTGMSVADSLGGGWARAVHPDDLPGVEALWSEALTSGRGEIADTRYRLQDANGSFRWYRARMATSRQGWPHRLLVWHP